MVAEAEFNRCLAGLAIPVKFQFSISADRKSFEIGYIDKAAFTPRSSDFVMAFIYR